MAVVRAAHKERTGRELGAGAWLAKKLGVTRQSIDNYGNRKGFPRRFAAKLVKITGLTENDIWPGTRATVDFPTEIWDTVTKRARRAGRSPPEIVVELVRIGLNSDGEK